MIGVRLFDAARSRWNSKPLFVGNLTSRIRQLRDGQRALGQQFLRRCEHFGSQPDRPQQAADAFTNSLVIIHDIYGAGVLDHHTHPSHGIDTRKIAPEPGVTLESMLPP